MASNASAWNDTSCDLNGLFFFYSKNVFAFIYVLLFLLGVPGNTLLFLVLIQGLQRKSGNWVSRLTDPLFVSIVVLDLLFFLFNMPVMFANLIFKDWYLGHLLYIPNHCLSLWISFADFYTMLAISLLRYMAVIHPMSLILISQKHIAVACMFIWAICLLFTTPFWIHYGSVHMEGETYCVNQMAWKQMNLYLKLLGGVAFLFPTMLIIFCYSRIISTLRARRMLSVHTASSLHVNWHAIIIAFVTMVALVAMWLPYWLVIFFIKCNEFLTTVPTYLVYHLTSFLAYANRCINPIICFCLSSQFQARLRILFRRASQKTHQLGCIHMGKIEILNKIRWG